MLPVWLDPHGRRRPTVPCLQCGAPSPILRLTRENLRRLGWAPFRTQRIPDWCGHSAEYVAWPRRLIAILILGHLLAIAAPYVQAGRVVSPQCAPASAWQARTSGGSGGSLVAWFARAGPRAWLSALPEFGRG